MNWKQKLYLFFFIKLPLRIDKWVDVKELKTIIVRQQVGACGENLKVNGKHRGLGKNVFLGHHVNFNDNVFVNGSGEVHNKGCYNVIITLMAPETENYS